MTFGVLSTIRKCMCCGKLEPIFFFYRIHFIRINFFYGDSIYVVNSRADIRGRMVWVNRVNIRVPLAHESQYDVLHTEK